MSLTSSDTVVAVREYIGRALPAESIRGRLVRGSAWSFVASTISRVFAMVALIIVVRLLGKETYGEFSMIQRTVSMFGVFGSLGLGVTATKFVSESYRTDPEKAGRVLGLALVCVGITSALVFAVLLALAPWLAETVLNRPSLGPMLRIGCMVLLLSAIGSVLTGGLAGLEAFKDIAGIHFWQGAIHVLTVGPLVWFWGIQGALVWLIVDAVAVIALSLNRLRTRCQPHRLELRVDRRLLRELNVVWRFAVPVTLANLMTGPVLWAAAAVLANQPGGYVQLGLYNAALQWGTVVLMLPAIFGTVFLPILSSIPASQVCRKRMLLTKSFGLCLGSAATVAAIMCILAKLILGVYGRDFIQARSIFMIVMATSVLSAGNEILYRALLANGNAWWRLLSNGAWGAGLICLSMIFVPRFAGLGLAIATLGAAGIHFAIQGILSYRLLHTNTTLY